MFPDVSCEYVVGAEKIFPVCTGDGGGQSVGRGGQYLLEPGVGGITHELQNEPFAGGEEGAALAHPGQRHQPVHLAAGGRGVHVCMRCQCLGLDTQTPGKLGRDPTPWFFLGAPNPSHMHPTPEGTLSPAGGAGVHHHVDLQPLVQEVQGCVLGAERGKGYPQTRIGILGE